MDTTSLNFLELVSKSYRVTSLAWTFADDYVWDGSRLLLRSGSFSRNLALANSVFEILPSGSDVEISLVCVIDTSAMATIWLPGEPADSEERFVVGQKLRCPTRLPHAVLVSDGFSSSARVQTPSPIDDLLTRSELEARLAACT